MRRTKKSSIISLICKPLCMILFLFCLFGMVWLRSGVTSTAYTVRELEDKRTVEIKEMKSLLAERSRLMALANVEFPQRDSAQRGRKLVSGGYVFPDRVKVIHVQRTKGPEVYRAAYRPAEQR